MNESVNSAKMEMVEAGGRTAQSFGLSRLLGQIYMFLYLSPEPLCLDEIANGLGVSKASVSIACRQLEGWGALKGVWKKGDRKDYYKAETDFRQIFDNGLMPSIMKKLNSAKLQINRSKQLLEVESLSENNQFLYDRLDQAEKYRAKIVDLLKNPITKRLYKGFR